MVKNKQSPLIKMSFILFASLDSGGKGSY